MPIISSTSVNPRVAAGIMDRVPTCRMSESPASAGRCRPPLRFWIVPLMMRRELAPLLSSAHTW